MGKPAEYRRRVLHALREAGAVGDGQPKTAEELGITDEYELERLAVLVEQGIVTKKGDGYVLIEEYREPLPERIFHEY